MGTHSCTWSGAKRTHACVRTGPGKASHACLFQPVQFKRKGTFLSVPAVHMIPHAGDHPS
jgi:hypothetical protein